MIYSEPYLQKDAVMPDHLTPSRCPISGDRDDRKSAALAGERVHAKGGVPRVGVFGLGRAILRSSAMVQAGLDGDAYAFLEAERAPVFFLDGEPHRRKRAAIAKFFTPKAISSRHQKVMEACTESLLAKLKHDGRMCLDQMAWQLAVQVAGEIVGLTIGLTEAQKARLAQRIERVMARTELHLHTGMKRRLMEWRANFDVLVFQLLNVRPAIRARRRAPQEDIISHLVAEGYSDVGVLIECMTYAGAGMVTTREFIVMVAWHLFEREDVRSRYLYSSEDEQAAILEEILRLEPVAALLYRKSEPAVAAALPEGVAPGETYAVDLRGVNVDESATGPCPFALDPDRASRMKMPGAFLSFGDGSHRCPGAQVALTETRIFIDRLLRVPGVHLAEVPRMGWNDALMSYELRGAAVAC